MHTGNQTAAVPVAYGTDHPRSVLLTCSSSYCIVTVYIATERPLDGVNGGDTQSYVGLAEYPVFR